MDLSPKTIEVTVSEQKYNIRRASVTEVRQASKRMTAASEDTDKVLDLQSVLIEKCGMPRKIIDALDMEQFTALAECVMGAKKN